MEIVFQALIEDFLLLGRCKTNAKIVAFDDFVRARLTLVDAQTPVLIKQLQQKGIPVIALTLSCVGQVGTITHYEDWRIKMLKAFGIDLSSTFACYSGFVFKQLEHNRRCPMFKSGVISTTGIGKGQVLSAFLALIKWCPNYIIFVDDLMKNVRSVQIVAEKLNIPFLGLHYTAASKVA